MHLYLNSFGIEGYVGIQITVNDYVVLSLFLPLHV